MSELDTDLAVLIFQFDIFRASETVASTHVATSRDEGLQSDWDPSKGLWQSNNDWEICYFSELP